MGQQVRVISLLQVDVVSEERDHILVCLCVEMMHLVSLVEDVCQHIRGRRVDDGGADDVGHVAVVFVFGYIERLVGVELADGGEVDVAAQDRDAHVLGRGDVLQLFDEPVPLGFVVLSCPVVVQVVEDFDAAVEFVEEVAQDAGCSADCFDGVHHPAGQDVFEEV